MRFCDDYLQYLFQTGDVGNAVKKKIHRLHVKKPLILVLVSMETAKARLTILRYPGTTIPVANEIAVPIIVILRGKHKLLSSDASHSNKLNRQPILQNKI